MNVPDGYDRLNMKLDSIVGMLNKALTNKTPERVRSRQIDAEILTDTYESIIGFKLQDMWFIDDSIDNKHSQRTLTHHHIGDKWLYLPTETFNIIRAAIRLRK